MICLLTSNSKAKLATVSKRRSYNGIVFIAIFKIKAHTRMNETSRNSQKEKHIELCVGLRLEEYPASLL